ncbi:MAG: helix-turn-helix transcriptional regulator [Planctomycetota bacterium]
MSLGDFPLTLSLISYLRRKGRATFDELEQSFGLTREELLDMLGNIGQIGVPPYGGGDYIQVRVLGDEVLLGSAEHFKGACKLNVEELASLRLWLQSLSVGDGPWRDVVEGLTSKFEDLAMEGSGDSLDTRRVGESRGQGPRIGAIDAALRKGQSLILDYFSSTLDRIIRVEVVPHGLVDRRGYWSLVAESPEGDLREYRVDRIRSLEAGVPRSRRLKVDLDSRVAPGYRGFEGCRVRVRARPPLDGELKRLSDQKVRADAHGGVLGDVVVSNPMWLITWILRHVPHLEVVDAKELSKPLADRLDEMIARTT